MNEGFSQGDCTDEILVRYRLVNTSDGEFRTFMPRAIGSRKNYFHIERGKMARNFYSGITTGKMNIDKCEVGRRIAGSGYRRQFVVSNLHYGMAQILKGVLHTYRRKGLVFYNQDFHH